MGSITGTCFFIFLFSYKGFILRQRPRVYILLAGMDIVLPLDRSYREDVLKTTTIHFPPATFFDHFVL